MDFTNATCSENQTSETSYRRKAALPSAYQLYSTPWHENYNHEGCTNEMHIMKKIWLLVFLFCGTTTIYAQRLIPGKGAFLGFKAGANLSNVIKSGEGDFKSKFKPGFAAGIFVDIPVVEGLSFAPEIVFSQKGYQSSGSILGGDYDYKVTTNFIDLPVLAKFWIAEGFNLSIGPQVSFLLSTTESFKSGSREFRTTVEETNKGLKKSLVGGVVGLGYEIGGKLGVNAHYALDFQKNNADGSAEVPAYKNQVIQLGLTYQF